MTMDLKEKIKKHARLFQEIDASSNHQINQRMYELEKAIETEPDEKIKATLQKLKKYILGRARYYPPAEPWKSNDPIDWLD